jgi:hypothetical protein
MSALGSVDLQNSTTAHLASQIDQPAGPSVLHPFSEKLSVDGELKLSNENFKQLIENSFNTNIKLFSQVQRMLAVPTAHSLTQFPSKANTGSTYDYFFKCKVVTL